MVIYGNYRSLFCTDTLQELSKKYFKTMIKNKLKRNQDLNKTLYFPPFFQKVLKHLLDLK